MEIRGSQIKDGTITAADIEDGSITMTDLSTNVQTQMGSAATDVIVQKLIETMTIFWALVDPANINDDFQVCNGAVWKNPSYAKSYWEVRGITNIPDLRSFGVRASSLGDTDDPDRNERRQVVTGNINVGTSVVITLPKYYINIISEAQNAGRTVIIGKPAGALPAAMFDTLTIYGTVQSVNSENNTVTLMSVTGTFTTGTAQSLVIKGDCVGSFQMDQFESHRHEQINTFIPTNYAAGDNVFGNSDAYSNSGTLHNIIGNPATDGTYPLRTGAETRGKNISYLPLMWVKLPSQSTAPVSFVPETLKNISSVQIPTSNFGETIDGYAKFVDEKPSGTDAGASSSGWNTRTLNTQKENTIAGSSLSNNRITLPAGTYIIKASAPCYAGNRHQLCLYNETLGVTALEGEGSFASASYAVENKSTIFGKITITQTCQFYLRHYIGYAFSPNGLGVSGTSGNSSIFTYIEITKIKPATPYLDIESRTFDGIDSRIFTRKSIEDLIIKNNTTYPNYKLDVSFVGLKCEDQYSENFSQTVDITTMLDTGNEQISTWYYVWFIMGSGITSKCILSQSNINPVMPIGYTKKRLIGAVYNNASGNFDTFNQKNKNVNIGNSTAVNGSATSWTAISLIAIIPKGIVSKISGRLQNGAPSAHYTFISPTNSLIGGIDFWGGSEIYIQYSINIITDQIMYYYVTGGATIITISSYELDI